MNARQGLYRLLSIAVLMVSIASGGCSRHGAHPPLDPAATPPLKVTRADLKRTVGIFTFENQSRFMASRIAAVFQDNFIFKLHDDCPELQVDVPQDVAESRQRMTLPRRPNGTVDNMALVAIGRRNGYNAMVAATLNSISANEEDSGMLWFKDKYHYFRVQVHFDVYDTETGAKLLDESLRRDIEVDGFEVDLFRERRQIEPYVLDEAFEDITASFTEKVCDAVRGQPWKGYVTAVDDDRVSISAGENAGLRRGVVLAVYHSDQRIEGAGGQRFYLPGTLTARIQIQQVGIEQAEALLFAGGPVQVGDLVRPE